MSETRTRAALVCCIALSPRAAEAADERDTMRRRIRDLDEERSLAQRRVRRLQDEAAAGYE